MLFKNIEEVVTYIPVVGSTNFSELVPFINQAERDYIIPYISQEQYDDLDTAYNAEDAEMTEIQKELLKRVQAALAQYFFFYWIPSAQLIIGSNGIRIANTNTMKTAFPWQIDELRNSVLKAAGSAMESLLSYMEANTGLYTLWYDSDAYTEFKDCFITSAIQFTKLVSSLGNSRLNFIAIRNSMKNIQEFLITDLMGDEFYSELKTQFIDDSLTAENKVVVSYIQKVLAPLTMGRAITELSVIINERGILNFANTRNTDSENLRTPAAQQMITKLETRYTNDGNAFVKKMMDYIYKNINDYPTFKNSSTYVDPTIPVTVATGSENIVRL